MAGQQIDRLRHGCGDNKALIVFAQEDGTVDGYCFACGNPVPNPYGEAKKVKDLPPRKVKDEKEIEAEIAEISSYQSIDLPARKIRGKSLEKFGAKVALSEFDGITPTATYWPITKEGVLTGYHVKVISKEDPSKTAYVFNIGNTKGGDLINWENAKASGAYKLIITEGPEDMVSVDRVFELYGDEKYHPAVVSLPRGAGSAKFALSKHASEIRRMFKEVIFCFDQDDAGKNAVKDAMMALPTGKSVDLPYKDANTCIMEGRGKELHKLLSFKASTPKNTRLITGDILHVKAKQPPRYGELTWPFEQMNDDLRGCRLGETVYVGAGVKMGKSSLKNHLLAHFMKNDGVKVFGAFPEEPNEKSYKMLAGNLVGKSFLDPKIEFDEDAYEEAGKILRPKLLTLNLYQHLGWDTLKNDIVEASSLGAKVVAIDPVTNLTNGIDPSSTNTFLQGFAQELSSMAQDLGFVALIFCHLNTPEGQISEEQRSRHYSKGKYFDLGNCSHELGGTIYSTQFAGSRGMMRSCHLMLGIKGNKDVRLSRDIQDTRLLSILEDREYNNNTQYELKYNREEGRFYE